MISPLSALHSTPPSATDPVRRNIYKHILQSQTLLTNPTRRPFRTPSHPRCQRAPNAGNRLQHTGRNQPVQVMGDCQRLRRHPSDPIRQRGSRGANVPSVPGARIATRLDAVKLQVRNQGHLRGQVEAAHIGRGPQRSSPGSARAVRNLPETHHGSALRCSPRHLEPGTILRLLGVRAIGLQPRQLLPQGQSHGANQQLDLGARGSAYPSHRNR